MTVYLGIDWSRQQHALVFLNEKGGILAETTIQRTSRGFAKLDQMRQSCTVSAGACIVGIESSHLLLIDWLWGHGYSQVYVIPPNVTRSRQKTYRQSQARTDRHDAYLIANLLRTDRHLLHPWHPDSAHTQELRGYVSLRMQLAKERMREQNRLRDLLIRYYPAILDAFSLDSNIGLAFLQAFPTPQAADNLRWAEFQAFAQTQAYTSVHQSKAFARLQADYPLAQPDVVSSCQPRAMLLAQRLARTRQALKETEKQMSALYADHPDAFIFDSLPGVGEILAPALLSKLGDDRQRFPQPTVLQAIAGTAPVTEQSGQSRHVQFRQACDRELRAFAQQWAKASVTRSPWANAYFTTALSRGHSRSRAYRGLANRWMAILWKLWQSREPYDEDFHLQRVKERQRPRH